MGALMPRNEGRAGRPVYGSRSDFRFRCKKQADMIPSAFTNHTRLAEEHGKKVAKCAQRNKKIEASDGAARAKDFPKE